MKAIKPKRIRAKNGDLFIVRTPERDLALGLVARGNHRSGILGYFFPLERLRQAGSIDALTLEPEEAFYIKKLGYLHIRDGQWPVIGRLPGFDPAIWRMPKFERLPGHGWRQIVEYDEERTEIEIACQHIENLPPDYDLSFVVPDGDAGAEFVEIVLGEIVDGKRKPLTYFRPDAKH